MPCGWRCEGWRGSSPRRATVTPRAVEPGSRVRSARPHRTYPHRQRGAAASAITKRTASMLHFPELGKCPTRSAWAVNTRSAITSSLDTRRDREAGRSAVSRARRGGRKDSCCHVKGRRNCQKCGREHRGSAGRAGGGGWQQSATLLGAIGEAALTSPRRWDVVLLRSPPLGRVPWGPPPPPPPLGSGGQEKVARWGCARPPRSCRRSGHPSLGGPSESPPGGPRRPTTPSPLPLSPGGRHKAGEQRFLAFE